MSWNKFLQNEMKKKYFQEIESQVAKERSLYTIYPVKGEIFYLYQITSPENIKVVILGQDPYPGFEIINNQEIPYAMGLSFSVKKGLSLPKSLINIFAELKSDLNIDRENGDLTDWATQGVFLLNTGLSVRKGQPLSHEYIKWDLFTQNTLRYLLDINPNIVFLLWGKKAELATSNLPIKYKIISPHPSPLSAYRGFFGSKPFSRTNKILKELNKETIEW